MMLIVLHLIPDSDDPYGVVARLMDSLAPGSYLVITHPASDIKPVAIAEMTRRINARLGPARGTMRDRSEITRFFGGLGVPLLLPLLERETEGVARRGWPPPTKRWVRLGRRAMRWLASLDCAASLG